MIFEKRHSAIHQMFVSPLSRLLESFISSSGLIAVKFFIYLYLTSKFFVFFFFSPAYPYQFCIGKKKSKIRTKRRKNKLERRRRNKKIGEKCRPNHEAEMGKREESEEKRGRYTLKRGKYSFFIVSCFSCQQCLCGCCCCCCDSLPVNNEDSFYPLCA